MKIGIYPGSFDPITYGHIDIIERASKIVDKLIVAVLNNKNKKSLFSMDERIEMIKDAIKNDKNIEVESYSGLLVDYAKSKDAKLIVRGLRAVTDFDYELQFTQTNRQLDEEIDTIFMPTSLKFSYLSSSVVKEVAAFNGDISKFVTPFVEKKVKEKFKI